MCLVFYVFALLTILFTVLSILQNKVMYALFYFFISVLTTSGIFFLLGNYIIGSLHIIIYSGAILVLFIFVVMLLNYDKIQGRFFFQRYSYFYLSLLISCCIITFYKLFFYMHKTNVCAIVNKVDVLGKVLFEPYIVFIEFISILLLSIIVVVILIAKNRK